jgi:chromosome segregation ATPase
LIPPDDDGIVVVDMSEIEPRTVTREAFNRELVQALDDLVADARHHGELIKAAFDKPARPAVARERPPVYTEVPERLDRIEERVGHMEKRLDRVEERLDRLESRMDRMEARLDRIERTLTEIRERMATKVELEETNENVKKMADGYVTIGKRLDAVADLLKLRVVMP